MGLFRKKESVPELPPAPPLPEPPVERTTKPEVAELPTLPPSKETGSFDERLVKSAVEDLSSPEEKEGKFAIEEDEAPEEIDELPEISEESVERIPSKRSLEIAPKPLSRPEKPIFVRIDKYKEAQKSLEKIRRKVAEINDLIEKEQGINLSEAKELEKWHDELIKLKSRLSEIDTNLFSGG